MSTFQRQPIGITCLADLCLVPVRTSHRSHVSTKDTETEQIRTKRTNITTQIGTATPSVSTEVAKIELLIQKSGLKHTLHSAGTTIEGEWDDVMNLIGQLHKHLHEEGVLRIQSDVRIGTRIDKSQTAQDKIDIVNLKMKELGQ